MSVRVYGGWCGGGAWLMASCEVGESNTPLAAAFIR